MRRSRTMIRALTGAALAAGSLVAVAPAAQAITIPVACSQTALVNAVNLANSTSAADTLVLASGCTYVLTSAHGGLTDGLPVITTSIEMIGPATITRGPTALPFRIAEVATTGSLTLTTGVAITNGSAIGDGGGILNYGAVTLTNSSLTSNAATGDGGGLANADTASGTAPAATFTRSPVTNNTALHGGGIYNGLRGTLTTTGVTGSPLFIEHNTATLEGGGIAAVNSTATTLTQTAVTVNASMVNAGGVYRESGTMTTTNSPITANTVNNCVSSAPAVPNCTG